MLTVIDSNIPAAVGRGVPHKTAEKDREEDTDFTCSKKGPIKALLQRYPDTGK